jgi:hypothetical protein
MSQRLEAHFENRIYYYFIIADSKPGELKISMYGTPYTFIKSGGRWVNHPSNPLEMKSGLIGAVMLASGEI